MVRRCLAWGLLLASAPAAAMPVDDPPPESQPAVEAPPEAPKVDKTRLRVLLKDLDQTGSPSTPPPEPALTEPSAKPDQQRPLPDYDNRADEGADVGDGLLWVPRVVFFPVRVVTEYVIRRPLVWTITRMEEHYVIERFIDALTFGDIAIFPRFFLDFGVRPSAGLSVLWDNFIVDDNKLELGFGFGGVDWISATLDDTFMALHDDSMELNFGGSFLQRPDFVFYGVGADTRNDQERQYFTRTGEGHFGMRAFLSGLNRVNFGLRFQSTEFDLGRGDDTTVKPEQALDENGDPSEVFDFEDYLWLEAKLGFEADTRDPDTEYSVGSGLRLEGFTSYALNPGDTDQQALRLGGEAAGFWDITGHGHTLALRGYTEVLLRVGSDAPLPITELISLGGEEVMRSALADRFLGESAFELSLDYRWPVWVLFDAVLYVNWGNAYEGLFEGFDAEQTFLGGGFGFRSTFSREFSLHALFGWTSDRLDEDDVNLHFTRFTLGISRGF